MQNNGLYLLPILRFRNKYFFLMNRPISKAFLLTEIRLQNLFSLVIPPPENQPFAIQDNEPHDTGGRICLCHILMLSY